jgi:hypothetical protein
MTSEQIISGIEDIVMMSLPLTNRYTASYEYKHDNTTIKFKQRDFDFFLKIIIYSQGEYGLYFVDVFINDHIIKTDVIYNDEGLLTLTNFIKYVVD